MLPLTCRARLFTSRSAFHRRPDVGLDDFVGLDRPEPRHALAGPLQFRHIPAGNRAAVVAVVEVHDDLHGRELADGQHDFLDAHNLGCNLELPGSRPAVEHHLVVLPLVPRNEGEPEVRNVRGILGETLPSRPLHFRSVGNGVPFIREHVTIPAVEDVDLGVVDPSHHDLLEGIADLDFPGVTHLHFRPVEICGHCHPPDKEERQNKALEHVNLPPHLRG